MAAAAQETALTLDPDRQAIMDEMAGHAPAREFLRACLKRGDLPQSLLLAGPEGVGKRTLAWGLIKEMTAGPGVDPRVHSGAGKIARGTHPDVMLCDDSAGASGQILIDAIRGADEWLSTPPIEAPRKFLLIVPAEAMNTAAANSLLKLLEEPPRFAQLILASHEPARLMATIRSRCTPILLDPVGIDELTPWLVRRAPGSADQAEIAARIAGGCPGKALELLEAGGLSARKELIEELNLLGRYGFAAIFRFADRLATVGGGAPGTIETLLMVLRDALAVKLGSPEILNRDLRGDLEALAKELPAEGLLAAAEAAALASQDWEGLYTPQAQAHFLELFAVRVGRELRKR